ncbi:MAG: C40 family peptidase [Gemmatimonadaceae bacterium]
MTPLVSQISLACLLALVISHDAEAQRARKKHRKPFAAFSESAERLKDSLAARVKSPDPSVLAPSSAFILPATQELMLRDSLISLARSQVGTRYRLGAQQPGKAFDCSGLVRFVMGMLRLDLPRTADEQARVGTEIPRDIASLRPGDLLTFGTKRRITHIGIYAGDGKVIHASTARRQVIETDMERLGPKLLATWRSARRLIAMSDTAVTEPLLTRP